MVCGGEVVVRGGIERDGWGKEIEERGERGDRETTKREISGTDVFQWSGWVRGQSVVERERERIIL